MISLENNNGAKLRKSILITLLKTFSKGEMKEFSRFAKSTFFNQRQDVSDYISLLAKHHPEFAKPSFTKEELHSQIYPRKKFNDVNIRRLNSFSLKLTEEFLYYVHGKNDSFEKNHYLILEYMKRDNMNLAASKIENCANDLRMDSLFNKDYFDRRSKLNSFMSHLEKYKKKDSLSSDYLLRSCSDSITGSMAELASNFSTLHMEMSFFKIDLAGSAIDSYFSDLDIPKMLKRMKDSGDENYAYLKMHYLMAKCIKNTLDDDAYIEFTKLLNELEHKMSIDSLVQLGWFRYNYILKKLKVMAPRVVYLGMYELIKELCYKNLLKFSHEPYIVRGHGLILGGGDMAGSKGDVDFLVYLQEHLVAQVHPEFRFLTGQFLKLHENYIRKKYDECVNILNSTHVDHYLFFQRFKILEVQIFFDLGEYEHVLSLIDSFKHFYKNKHVTAKLLDVIMKFLNALARLSKLAVSFTEKEAIMIEKAISEINANILRNWLIPRLQLIRNRH